MLSIGKFYQLLLITVPSETRKRKRNSDGYLQRKRRRVESSDKKHAYEWAIHWKIQFQCAFFRPDPKYYSDDGEETPKVYDKYDLCIDLSDSTDELKAIRRNCLPNCIIRYVILHQRMEVFVMAQKDIVAGEEVRQYLLHRKISKSSWHCPTTTTRTSPTKSYNVLIRTRRHRSVCMRLADEFYLKTIKKFNISLAVVFHIWVLFFCLPRSLGPNHR